MANTINEEILSHPFFEFCLEIDNYFRVSKKTTTATARNFREKVLFFEAVAPKLPFILRPPSPSTHWRHHRFHFLFQNHIRHKGFFARKIDVYTVLRFIITRLSVEAKHINVTMPQMKNVLKARLRTKMDEMFCSCLGKISNSSAMASRRAQLNTRVVSKRPRLTRNDLWKWGRNLIELKNYCILSWAVVTLL